MIIGGGVFALLLICGVFALVGSLVGPPKEPAAQPAGAHGAVGTMVSTAPTVTTKTVTEAVTIPFLETTVDDPTLAKGSTSVTVVGVNGEKTVTYSVTYTNGTETARTETNSVVTKEPVNQVTAIGTKTASAPKPPAPPASNCNPNYDPCVPNASDVDCAGGSGDGPAYVTGPIRVIGQDVYKLDSDHDGIACE